jgi:hypothetical protein
MNITLRLTPEVERRLAGQAARSGMTVAEYLERLAGRAAAAGIAVVATPQESWEAEWRSWAASHQKLPSVVDDDRECIYAGRGE